MNHRPYAPLAALALVLAAAPAAQAHRQWLLPSATVLSGEDPWVTVDAAVSNTLFFPDHVPMRLEEVTVVGPKGAQVPVQNKATGKYRSTFDVQLGAPGTYRIANAGGSVMASYKLNGEQKRWRGPASQAATAVPAGAQEVKLTHNQRRVETFVTRGAPTTDALKPTGQGLELQPVTHPNDLFAGEKAQFRLLMDGKPASGVEVEVVPGGTRYRESEGMMKLTTGADGGFQVTWPEPGMYWLEASTRGGASPLPGAESSASYVAVLEVLND